MKAAVQKGMDLIKNNFQKDIEDLIILGDTNKIEILIQKAMGNGVDQIELLNIALLVAFDHQQSEMIEYMLFRGADINVKKENDLKIAIFAASERGDLDWFIKIFDKLSQQDKAKLINSKNANKETPLFVVANKENPDEELINFLAENGATIEVINKNDQSLASIFEEKVIIINYKNKITQKPKPEPIKIQTSEPIDIKLQKNTPEIMLNNQDYANDFSEDHPQTRSSLIGCGSESKKNLDQNGLMFPID